MSHKELLEFIASSIRSANTDKRLVNTPGGVYAPFILEGVGGFLVIKDTSVVTALEVERCPEVILYLERHGHHCFKS